MNDRPADYCMPRGIMLNDDNHQCGVRSKARLCKLVVE